LPAMRMFPELMAFICEILPPRVYILEQILIICVKEPGYFAQLRDVGKTRAIDTLENNTLRRRKYL
jgi:hypothetical protein